MRPTKERNLRVSGKDERLDKQRMKTFTWGLRPQTPGIYRVDANPSE
jgi:hypothetical protein